VARDGGWVSASDLADYAYCPRAHWYQGHPPPDGPAPAARERSESGRRYHADVLGAERRREERGGAYWVALLVGVVLVLGGIAWIFRP
jgi:CRISPR/Cas system-associated exonuclease Cas4 (RecB family)